MQRRTILKGLGISGGLSATGTVALRYGLPALERVFDTSGVKRQQLALKLLAPVLALQAEDGALSHQGVSGQSKESYQQERLYLSAALAMALTEVGLELGHFRRRSQEASLADFFERQSETESLGARSLTDSITRLRVARAVGFPGNTREHRLSETRRLLSERLDAEIAGKERSEQSYRYYGLLAMHEIGVPRDDVLFRTLNDRLGELKNPDFGHRQHLEAEERRSVTDLSAVAVLAGAPPEDLLTFLTRTQNPDGHWGFYPQGDTNLTSVALVGQALPRYRRQVWDLYQYQKSSLTTLDAASIVACIEVTKAVTT